MLTLTLSLLLACRTEVAQTGQDITTPTKVPESQKVVVYSGRGESLVGELFSEIEKELQIDIEVQYGSTSEMATRFLTEGEQSPADIIFAQDSGHLGALATRGSLATLSPELLNNVDERFRAKDGTWVGTSGRLRVLVFDSKQISVEDMQSRLRISDPKWKVNWAGRQAMGLFKHMSVYYAMFGVLKPRLGWKVCWRTTKSFPNLHTS